MKNHKIHFRNNIWNAEDFRMSELRESSKLIGRIKHTKRCLRWSLQRITRGYAECDRWDMDGYLSHLFPEMLQDLRDNRMGSPSYLGEDYMNEDGILVNDTCHEEWDRILDRMIFLWREADENTCTRKNSYEVEYDRASAEFHEKYGFWGENLQTEAELEENRKRGGGGTMHFMDELPEYKEISNKYHEESRKLEQYRRECKDEAFDLMKEHFYALWD